MSDSYIVEIIQIAFATHLLFHAPATQISTSNASNLNEEIT